ncbi:hypothetical protein E5720_09940 [Rhodococcus sp. PAMC28707]|uniref:DUF6153 family protein n=1 Tax=unclassified Rhodococcus (in: high G+C Gram-positive bacteria) TaxID=192944 RepID=UPI00109DABD4|nr:MULTISPECIES: DUF6153 family protein [unclassified Rhodococcus (in: high G+C Gram-positive bacteria)]QCB49520.1 hypothetical protein E5769_04075 [Rhodococcus sp. PAMC28705]QCB58790.1 hypothetical protein E5720_09940 [Rhodococcus sp. PAMC28707]
MHSVIRGSRRGTASATGLLIAFTIFGVLLMHSVTPMSSMSSMSPMGNGHSATASEYRLDASGPVAFGEHDCPSAHQMMHPCAGTTTSWPALTVPTTSIDFDLSPRAVDIVGGRPASALERAPPWVLSELDKSVTLRV